MGAFRYSSGHNQLLFHPLSDSAQVEIYHKLQFCSQYICVLAHAHVIIYKSHRAET